MKVTTSVIEGLMLFQPTPIRDDRGFFTRTLDVSVLERAGLDPASFKQENQSRSFLGGVRGLHGRLGEGEAKLARCARGAVLDVVLDARPDSPTFGTVEAFVLDDIEHRQVFVPAGCLHGYQAITGAVDFCYRTDRFYEPGEVGVNPYDPDLGIAWREPRGQLSAKDAAAPTWVEFRRDLLGIPTA
jgi:dTDP-4-dehydrorhamnose 3,5-epimerase